ncbi:MAG: hypothetical protein U0270_28755 [Labilithrix sp.]
MLATCNFCGNPASLGPMPKLWVCRTCAARIGTLATEAHARVWSTQARSPRQAPAEQADVERVFEEFKAGVAKQIRADDFEAHLDLAEAYREMGLLEDALREAGLVLTSASKRVLPIPTKMTDIALRLLLTPPLLKPRGLHHLELLLHRAN